jgi:hypothetical protein
MRATSRTSGRPGGSRPERNFRRRSRCFRVISSLTARLRRRSAEGRAAELLDPRLVDALDEDAADYGARNGSVAKPPEHDSLDLRGRRIEDAVSDVVARKDGPDLPAVGAPRRVVHDNALATPRLGRDREVEQRSNSECGDQARATDNGSASGHCFPHS